MSIYLQMAIIPIILIIVFTILFFVSLLEDLPRLNYIHLFFFMLLSFCCFIFFLYKNNQYIEQTVNFNKGIWKRTGVVKSINATGGKRSSLYLVIQVNQNQYNLPTNSIQHNIGEKVKLEHYKRSTVHIPSKDTLHTQYLFRIYRSPGHGNKN